MEVLEVKKDLLPYECSIQLAGEIFGLQFNYNATADLFTVDLYKDSELLCAGEPIIYGIPLWHDVYKADSFPALGIIPIDLSGEYDVVTFDNLSNTVWLLVDDGSWDVEAALEKQTTINVQKKKLVPANLVADVNGVYLLTINGEYLTTIA